MPRTTRGVTSVMTHLDQAFDARFETGDLLACAETSTPLAPFFGGPLLARGTNNRVAFTLLAVAIGRPRAEHLLLICAIGTLAVFARDINGIHQQPSADRRVRRTNRRSQ